MRCILVGKRIVVVGYLQRSLDHGCLPVGDIRIVGVEVDIVRGVALPGFEHFVVEAKAVQFGIDQMPVNLLGNGPVINIKRIQRGSPGGEFSPLLRNGFRTEIRYALYPRRYPVLPPRLEIGYQVLIGICGHLELPRCIGAGCPYEKDERQRQTLSKCMYGPHHGSFWHSLRRLTARSGFQRRSKVQGDRRSGILRHETW